VVAQQALQLLGSLAGLPGPGGGNGEAAPRACSSFAAAAGQEGGQGASLQQLQLFAEACRAALSGCRQAGMAPGELTGS
jgi:hypothetical protein